MKNFHGNVLQRNISKVFPSKLTSSVVEIIFLFLMGALAMLLHAKLKIPMHLPGKSGLFFMIILITARASSKYKFGASVACLGAASLFLFSNLGFNDPFMPIVYIVMGIIMDLLFNATSLIKTNIFSIALASGLSWMLIPLLRMLISFITGFPYESLVGGIFYPTLSHFIFGFTGGVIGSTIVFFANKNN